MINFLISTLGAFMMSESKDQKQLAVGGVLLAVGLAGSLNELVDSAKRE